MRTQQALPDPLVGVSAEELYRRAQSAARSGDHSRAEQYAKAAIDRGYDEREALPLLLGACVASNRLGVALHYVEPYLRDHPGDWALRYLKATLHLGLGDESQAREELEQVITDAPEGANAYYLLGSIEIETRQEHGVALLERYLELAPRGRHAAEVRALLARQDRVPIQRLMQSAEEVAPPETDDETVEAPEEPSTESEGGAG